MNEPFYLLMYHKFYRGLYRILTQFLANRYSKIPYTVKNQPTFKILRFDSFASAVVIVCKNGYSFLKRVVQQS